MKSIKMYSILLSTIMTFSLVSTAYGQDINVKSMVSSSVISDSNLLDQSTSKISKDDAKVIAKKTLNDYLGIVIDDTVYQTNINFTPNYRNRLSDKDYVWQISWNTNSQQKNVNVNINVTVNANSGKVTDVNSFTYINGQTSATATFTEDQAKKTGEDFLNKINPQEFSQCKLVDNSELNNMMRGNGAVYNFSYIRMANDIPFLGDSLNVGVDGSTGKVCSYNIIWSDNKIPKLSKDSIISKDKANQLLKDNLKFEPKYILCRDQYGMQDKTQTLKLVYALDPINGVSLDANTGIMINNATTTAAIKVRDLNETQKRSFTDSYKTVEKLSKELTSDSAEVIMKQIAKEIYGNGYDIQSTNYIAIGKILM